jgi:hypothetical protein
MQVTATETTAQQAMPSPSAAMPPASSPKHKGFGRGALGRRALAAGSTTPARLSLLRAVTVALAVLLAAIGAFGSNRRADAIDDVRQAAGQLLALQDIRVRVVHADAIASSSYLRSGQEDAKQRTAYLDEIARANDGLVAVSQSASTSDIAQLSEAARLLGGYVGLVEQARVNNRQGFPVGAAYQRQANGVVTNADPKSPDIVSSLRAVEASQRDRINANLARAHRAGVWLQLLGWLLLAVLGFGSLWLFRRFRRLVNIPIAVAAVAVLLLVLVGGSTQASSMSDSDDAVAGPLQSADGAAQARAAAFEARSQEALALINRGNGAANEINWTVATDTVGQTLAHVAGNEIQSAYVAYITAHQEIRALDDAGAWDDAVQVSLGIKQTPKGTNSVDQFNAFDQALTEIIASQRRDVETRLGSAIDPLRVWTFMVLLAALIAAVLVAVGYGQRLREYR